MMTSVRCLAATALIALLPLQSAAADVKTGEAAWRSGNYLGAVAAWRPLAEKGDRNAQFSLAEAYRLGRGVAADAAQARHWYERAAELNHGEAQASLGLILFQGGDREAGMRWIRKAAEGGNARARYVLGTALFTGDGEPVDRPRAYALMSRAASQGVTAAASSLAAMENALSEGERQRGMDLARKLARADAERDTPVAKAAIPAPSAIPAPQADQKPVSMGQRPKPRPQTPTGRWQVQLGAYESQAVAKGEWKRLARKMEGLSGLEPSYEPAGALTRLRVNSLPDRAAAQKLCEAAKAVGQACLAIAP